VTRWLRVVCLAIVLSTSWHARAAPAAVRRFALIIGNNASETSAARSLRYADDDALAMHQLLREAGVESRLLARLDAATRGLHPEAVVDGAPTLANLKREFASLARRIQASRDSGVPSELLLFYGGHGDVERGEGYVVLEDGRLTRSLLFELLRSSPATNNHVFIDACKSYYLVFDRGPGGSRGPYRGPSLAAVPAQLGNTGFVLSTSSDRESHEWERYQGGVLSHELRSALWGAADADLDGSITYAELGAFLTVANASIHNPLFRPDFTVHAPHRDLSQPLLSWNPSAAALEFGPGNWGHFYVETARGERLLDAHPRDGQPLRLWAPPERPLFVRRNDDAFETVINERAPTRVPPLSTPPQLASRGALGLALEWLFDKPFGADNVRDFRAARAPEPLAPPAVERVQRRDDLPLVAGTVALAAGAVGLTLNGVALGLSLGAQHESQLDIQHQNGRITTLNYSSLPFYGVAALAGATWAWATWLRTPGLALTPVVGARGEGGAMLDWRGSF
jgi:hypothetical protein